MNFKLNTPLTEAFDELDKLSEEARTTDDPYGYGPYKTPDDPTLRVGDYIKAKRYATDDKWYPGRVTEVTPDFVSYTISGWGFTKNGTALRSNRAKQAFGNLRKRLGEAMWNDPARTYTNDTYDETFKLIDKLMNEKYTEDFKLECPGFDEYIEFYDGTHDAWGGRGTSGGTVHIPDFEYPIEPDELLDFLGNIPYKELDKFVKYSKPTEVVNTFVTLQKAFADKNRPDTESEQKLFLFIAENLDTLFKDANDYIYDHYEADAYEWARYRN